MISEIFNAFLLIFLAEMGDKTQILAMAFATKYPIKKVLMGIFIGSLLNHGIAVMVGSQLTKIIPLEMIQIIAGVAFLVFAFWSLIDDEDDEEAKPSKFGPILTVALAFFIGELGDKTQLTAITLSTSATSPLLVLCGTVLGMIATGSLGIFIGKKLGNSIPSIWVKSIAAVVFLGVGTLKLYASLPSNFINPVMSTLYFIAIVGPFAWFIYIKFKRYKAGISTTFERQAKAVYEYFNEVEPLVDRLCLVCNDCDGVTCPVGQTRAIIADYHSEEENVYSEINDAYKSKTFDKQLSQKIIKLSKTVDEDNYVIQRINKNINKIT